MKIATKRAKNNANNANRVIAPTTAIPEPLTTRVSDVRDVYPSSPLDVLDTLCVELERVAADMTVDGFVHVLGPQGPGGLLRFVERLRGVRARILMGAAVANHVGGKTRRHFVASLLPQPLDARPARERETPPPSSPAPV